MVLVESQKALRLANALGTAPSGEEGEEDAPLREQYARWSRAVEELQGEALISDAEDRAVFEPELKNAREQVEACGRKLIARHPRYLSLTDARNVGLLDTDGALRALAALGTRTTLLGHFDNGRALWAYAIQGEAVALERVADRERIWIGAREFRANTMTGSASRSALLDSLSNALIGVAAPFIERMQPNDRLVVSPWAALAGVPFASLRFHDTVLGERVTLSVTPGLPTLRSCLRYPAVVPDSILAMGAPRRTVPAPPPHTRAEVTELGRRCTSEGHQAIVLVDEQATIAALCAHAPRAAVVHLSCHARLTETDGHPPHLFLAEAPDTGDSGLLTAARIRRELRLRAGALVVLAACESGEYQVGLGADAHALAPAFLLCGASTVICSLWPVRDRETSHFMRRFYDLLFRGCDPCGALAATQREARRGDLGASLQADMVGVCFLRALNRRWRREWGW